MNDRMSTPGKLALACLIWLLTASAAWAESAIVTESWLRLRNAPDKAGKAIGLVYGNDVYPVLKKEAAWVQLRTPQGQVGWVEAGGVELTEQQAAAADPERGKALNQAAILQRQGHRDKAAAGLAAVAGMLAAGMFEYNFGDSEFLMLFLVLITLPHAVAQKPVATPDDGSSSASSG